MTIPWIIVDKFFREGAKLSLHIIGVTDIQTLKKSRKYKVFLVNTGFFRKSE